MSQIAVVKNKIDIKKFLLQPVPEPPEGTLIVRESSVIYEDGQPIIGYYENIGQHGQNFYNLKQALRSIKYAKTERTGGLPTNSRIFGSAPRLAIRKDFCAKCGLSLDDLAADKLLKLYGLDVEKFYRATNPAIYDYHRTLVEKIRPEWRMLDSIWTQGIVNWNNQLRYHRDRGNFPKTWNGMYTFKQDVKGGYLHFPEYNLALELKDGSVSVFNGQEILHGVTPIKLQNRDAYRYTIVYYSLAQMVKCESHEQELSRIKKVKTQREIARAEKGQRKNG